MTTSSQQGLVRKKSYQTQFPSSTGNQFGGQGSGSGQTILDIRDIGGFKWGSTGVRLPSNATEHSNYRIYWNPKQNWREGEAGREGKVQEDKGRGLAPFPSTALGGQKSGERNLK